MKKALLFLIPLVIVSVTLAQNPEPAFVYMQTAVSNIAASATSSNAGPIIVLQGSPAPIRVWLTASGVAATTNGLTASSNLVVRLSTASGGPNTTNAFDNPFLVNTKISLTAIGSLTNTQSDYFELRGARYLRVGAIENNYLGAVSNIQVIVGFPK